MAEDLLTFYTGDKPGGTPGLLPQPYYCKLNANHDICLPPPHGCPLFILPVSEEAFSDYKTQGGRLVL